MVPRQCGWWGRWWCIMVCQHQPTASGHVFIPLENETGPVDLIVHPQIYKKRQNIPLQTSILVAVDRV